MIARLMISVLPNCVWRCLRVLHIRSQRLANVCGAHGWQSLAARWRQQFGFQLLRVHVVSKRGWQSLAKRSKQHAVIWSLRLHGNRHAFRARTAPPQLTRRQVRGRAPRRHQHWKRHRCPTSLARVKSKPQTQQQASNFDLNQVCDNSMGKIFDSGVVYLTAILIRRPRVASCRPLFRCCSSHFISDLFVSRAPRKS